MERYLYCTAIPVLLDGGRTAGRVARQLYTRYGLVSHCFCPRRHPLTAIYTRRHAALPFTEENDGVTLLLLRSFAVERRRDGGIPALIPCSPEAAAFLSRMGEALEEDYVLLTVPASGQNPLRELVRLV